MIRVDENAHGGVWKPQILFEIYPDMQKPTCDASQRVVRDTTGLPSYLKCVRVLMVRDWYGKFEEDDKKYSKVEQMCDPSVSHMWPICHSSETRLNSSTGVCKGLECRDVFSALFSCWCTHSSSHLTQQMSAKQRVEILFFLWYPNFFFGVLIFFIGALRIEDFFAKRNKWLFYKIWVR